MKIFTKMRRLSVALISTLLSNEYFRYIYVRIRFLYFFKFLKRIEVHSDFKNSINLKYNMTFEPAAFGCGQRMSILLNPSLGFLYPNHNTADVLICGPRTEDDIIWSRAIGFKKTIGLDIFSYSPLIKVGNALETEFADASFDLILLGWVLPYVDDPYKLISEMLRISRFNGIIGFAWQDVVDKELLVSDRIRGNKVNGLSEVLDLFAGKKCDIVGLIDCSFNGSDYKAIFVRKVA